MPYGRPGQEPTLGPELVRGRTGRRFPERPCDVAQRDNLRVGRHDGVVAVVEKLKGHPLFAHVTLTTLPEQVGRSPHVVTEMLENVTL